MVLATMRFLAAVTAIVSAFVVLPASAVTQIPIQKYNGTTTGRYIVQLKDGADKSGLQSQILQVVDGQVITHDWKIINGFAGMLH
jgi:cerevisin